MIDQFGGTTTQTKLWQEQILNQRTLGRKGSPAIPRFSSPSYTNKLGFTSLAFLGSPLTLAIIFDNQVVLGCLQQIQF